MEVEASLVSETTKRDACALGSCEQRKFAPDPIQLDAMLAALKLGVTGMIWGLPKKKSFRGRPWAVHDLQGSWFGSPIPMWKQLTGERSSRQGCQIGGVEVLLPSIARIWTVSISAARGR
jgi:hypothetical protein